MFPRFVFVLISTAAAMPHYLFYEVSLTDV